MAIVAACTDKGAKRSVNQDACCVQVAQTSFGEVIMAIVCDGVGAFFWHFDLWEFLPCWTCG